MSNTVLKTLSFSNMFSYGEDNTITLDHNQITQLDAYNGSGKSSVAFILQELLFNKNIKGIKKTDILNRYVSAKYWEATIAFITNNKDYEVTVRRQGATTKVTLLENSINISEHKVLDTYKKISDILGMTFEVFSQLTYQSSTNSLEFLKSTDANRKKFLINLFNLEKYIKIGDKIKVKSSVVDKELLGLQGELKSIDDFLDKTTIEQYKNEVVIETMDNTLVVRIAEIKKELDNITDTCKKIDKNNMYITDRDKLAFEIDMEEPEPFTSTILYEDYKADIRALTTDITTLTNDIRNINIKDTCPSCGQTIDTSHLVKIKADKERLIKEKTAEKQTAITEVELLDNVITEINKRKRTYANNLSNINRFEQLSQLIDPTVATTYPNVTELEVEKRTLENTYDIKAKQIKEAINTNKSVSAHNAKIDALIEQKNEFLNRQTTLKDAILIKLSQATNLNILKKAFSTSGIVAFKLENLTKELEININHYLALLSDGQFQVEFTLDKEKLNITVISDGVSAPIETTSGGEFSRIQTAILFAIRNVLSKLGGSSINLLFLDEIMGVLDTDGKEKLIEVLQEERDLNVFLISHDYSHPLIPKISITKKDNISTI